MLRQQGQCDRGQEKQDAEHRGGPRQRVRRPARAEKSTQPRATTAHSEGPPFGLLEQNDHDERDRDEKLKHDKHGLHGLLGDFGPLHKAWGQEREADAISPDSLVMNPLEKQPSFARR